ncbi:unnamed protein product [Rotaria sp. Silwood2]|nr:unnamed protein product [Rotaria sp. Silwood2]CAF4607245.1 unnamed protein product [Rotaria sp. Silwood2]
MNIVQKLSVNFILLNNQLSLFDLLMYYLLGIFGHTYFWSIINKKFQLIKQCNELKSIKQINKYIENFK